MIRVTWSKLFTSLIQEPIPSSSFPSIGKLHATISFASHWTLHLV